MTTEAGDTRRVQPRLDISRHMVTHIFISGDTFPPSIPVVMGRFIPYAMRTWPPDATAAAPADTRVKK
jgi:hypothetical protein